MSNSNTIDKKQDLTDKDIRRSIGLEFGFVQFSGKSMEDAIDSIYNKCKAHFENPDTRLREALEKIANWELPETGKFWDNDKKEPMSYEAVFGTNGSRDYFKNLAREALSNQ